MRPRSRGMRAMSRTLPEGAFVYEHAARRTPSRVVGASGPLRGSIPDQVGFSKSRRAARSKLSPPPIRVWCAAVNRLIVAWIVALALVLIELMAGGTRLVFSLPCYALLAGAAILAVFRKPDPRYHPAADAILVTLILFGYILWRATVSPIEYLWWTDFLMVLGCLAVYFLTAFHLTSLRERRIIIGALLVLSVFEILFGVRQFA